MVIANTFTGIARNAITGKTLAGDVMRIYKIDD
jgi:hypothetical protein